MSIDPAGDNELKDSQKDQQTIMADQGGLLNEIASAYDSAHYTELTGWIRACASCRPV
jgi:hypothetical protein